MGPRDPLPCREPGCRATFLGGSDSSSESFRVRHEAVVHGARYRGNPDGTGPAYIRDSVTSLSAAQQIRQQARAMREQVYEYLRVKGPATDQQIQDALRMDPSTERPRRVELVKESRVRDSGRTTRTHAGRGAVLWEVVL